MPQVSKYPLSAAVYDRIFEVLLKTISDLKSSKETDKFLDDFITPTEKIMFAKRLAIALLITKEYDFRSISKILRVSMTTVASVKLRLKYGDGGLRKAIDRIIREEKMEEFWQKVDDVLFGTIPPKGRNWKYWRKEREAKKRARKKPF